MARTPHRDKGAEADRERREFMALCGRFAALTPPAMTILLSTTLTSGAIAASGGSVQGNNGFGNGGGDGVPGNSGQEDGDR
jgi:hypothetical protein